jgi:hypothetical protein
MLTRLRQLALHPGLIPADYAEQLLKANEEDGATVVQLTAQEKLHLQNVLAQAIEDNEECPICFDTLNNPRITACSHRFCLDWYALLAIRTGIESDGRTVSQRLSTAIRSVLWYISPETLGQL